MCNMRGYLRVQAPAQSRLLLPQLITRGTNAGAEANAFSWFFYSPRPILCSCRDQSAVSHSLALPRRVDAQELQVSTTAEENARDAPACGRRAASSQQTIATALEKLQPALYRRAGSIEVPLGPPRIAEG
eukprot:scaffold97246_cov42-Phaeocystis_antarctica.AAC.1